MDKMDSYMCDIDDMLDQLEAEETAPELPKDKRSLARPVENVPEAPPSEVNVEESTKDALVDLSDIPPAEDASTDRKYMNLETSSSGITFHVSKDELLNIVEGSFNHTSLTETDSASDDTEQLLTISSLPVEVQDKLHGIMLMDGFLTPSGTEVSDSAYQSADGAFSADSSPQKDAYSPTPDLLDDDDIHQAVFQHKPVDGRQLNNVEEDGKKAQYFPGPDTELLQDNLNTPSFDAVSLNSDEDESSSSAKTPVSFQPAEWKRTSDVSEAELNDFFTSLSPQLQLNTADTDDSLDRLTDNTEIDSGDVSFTNEQMSDLNVDFFRLSPPLELAPPIPMALMDVSEFMDSSLDDVQDVSNQFGAPQPPSVFLDVEPPSDMNTANFLPEGMTEPSFHMEELEVQPDGQPLSVEMAQGVMDPANSSSDFLIAVEEQRVGENGENVEEGGDENRVPQSTDATKAVIFSADNLGKIKPQWVPDELAPICMLCGTKFTVVKRRHHCRACGSVICALCGNYKAKLDYLEGREDRVCALCNETFIYRNGGGSRHDDGYDARNSPSPVVLSSLNPRVPPGVLRRQDSSRREPRNVVFFDGIRPGGDLVESPFHGNPRRRAALMEARRQRRSPGAPLEAPPPPKPTGTPKKSSTGHVAKLFVHRDVLPVMEVTKDGHYILHEQPDIQLLQQKFQVVPSESVDFCVSSCLRVTVKLVNLQCCIGETVWCFTTSGMRLVGQDEIVIVLAKQEDDFRPPRDIFVHLSEIWLHAKQGNVIGNLGHSIIGLGGSDVGFLGNRNNAGFLFIRQSHQCMANLNLPEAPYLFGVLMTRWEVPWAKLFPLRLMLRLGAEYRYYPCPLVSFRNRKPVFEEVGHTVMNLLCDFRNFQYHLPFVENADCCMEKGVITMRIPRYRYDQIVKVCQAANEHVLPIGLSFSSRVDAHLVCVQNLENGQYETQAINIHDKGRQVTGTSFIIFNASLKSTEMNECRTSVVEDGIMVQISARGLEQLKAALKSVKNFTFKALSTPTPKNDNETSSVPEERNAVVIEWTDDRKTCNAGVKSPIDGKDMTGIESRRVSLKHSTDFVNGNLSVRCTEVFLDDEKDPTTATREELDLSRLAENLALATCSVLRLHLYDYRDSGITRIGLRVCLGPDIVEYDVGSKGERFLPHVLMEFDDKIMPLLNECARLWGNRPRLEMELLFRVFPH